MVVLILQCGYLLVMFDTNAIEIAMLETKIETAVDKILAELLFSA